MKVNRQTKEKGDGGFSQSQRQMLLVLMAVCGLCPAMLVPTVTTTPYTTGFFYFLAYAAMAYGSCAIVNKKYGDGHEAEVNQLMKNEFQGIVRSSNSIVQDLVREYRQERRYMRLGGSTHALRERFSHLYDNVETQFNKQKEKHIGYWKKNYPHHFQLRSLWGWMFVIVPCAMIATFVGSVPADDSPATSTSAQRLTAETVYWNANNIPVPYLQDSTQYVSNPDHVLSQQAVDHINVKMRLLEDSLDIQSVVIVVNHIENDDPFRMAQDVGNRYGVGHHDRGLVVVVGYEDHSINMSPGRELEGDLTDAECRQLQQQYAVPFMRVDMPDSAMVYLADAIYAKLRSKELPQKAQFLSSKEAIEEDLYNSLGLYSCFLLLLLILFIYKNKVFLWVGGVTTLGIMSNPFVEVSQSSGFSSGGSHGGGFSGGGFSGGSFGGGSFGGGGATSRWNAFEDPDFSDG